MKDGFSLRIMNSHRHHTILIVEDYDTLRRAMSQLLAVRGYEVFDVPSAEAARAWMADRLPDAVLLDIGLPGISGLDYLQELRGSERTRHLPVLLFSSLRHTEQVRLSISLGASDFLPKPVDPDLLAAKLEAHLRYRDALHRLERHTELLARAGAVDPLTQLFTHAWLPEVLNMELERAALRHSPLAVALIDADVILSDASATRCGTLTTGARDEVLQVMARRLETALREADALARFGEDAFCAVMGGFEFSEAPAVAERIRGALESKALPLSDGGAHLSAAVGLAWIGGGVKGTERRLLDAARLALAEAQVSRPRRIVLRNVGPQSGPGEELERLTRTQAQT